MIDGRDARLFPGLELEFFTSGGALVPVQRGEMVRESAAATVPSYWRVIPQFGRVWHERADGDWSRAAFPLMLVNDTENHAHQGLATFLYKEGAVSALRFQFVQQTAPYLVRPHFVGWGSAPASLGAADGTRLESRRAEAAAEFAERLPARPWSELVRELPPGTLDGFGGPLYPKWMVEAALVRNGILYYQDSPTPYGPYPYPLEMRFGVRSVMKSVGAPLALLRLAEVYGPYVLDLKVGDFVDGLDPKYKRVRFIDAASMASGFGGTGTVKTHPNDMYDGYLGGNYDAWYTGSVARREDPADRRQPASLPVGARHRRALPGPGLLPARRRARRLPEVGARPGRRRLGDAEGRGVRADRHPPRAGGPDAGGRRPRRPHLVQRRLLPDARRPREDRAAVPGPRRARGRADPAPAAHRGPARGARRAVEDRRRVGPARAGPAVRTRRAACYRMGFHFTPYVGSASGKRYDLPTISGSGENEVILYPNGLVSIRTAKAAGLPEGEKVSSDDGPLTIRAVDRLAPF